MVFMKPIMNNPEREAHGISTFSLTRLRIGSLFRATMTNIWVTAVKKLLTSPDLGRQSWLSRLTSFVFCISE